MKIKCSYHKLIPLKDLKPNPDNPNQHPVEQIELLALVIKEIGFRDPITVSLRSGYVVRGHGRRLAALKLGVKNVPVDLQSYNSDAAEMADLMADNRIKEFSFFDRERLKGLLSKIADKSKWVMTAFSEREIGEIMADETSLVDAGFQDESGSGEVDRPVKVPGAARGPGEVKYYRLPVLLTVAERKRIEAAVLKYAEACGINDPAEALLRLVHEKSRKGEG